MNSNASKFLVAQFQQFATLFTPSISRISCAVTMRGMQDVHGALA
jgi:hypothetical protein